MRFWNRTSRKIKKSVDKFKRYDIIYLETREEKKMRKLVYISESGKKTGSMNTAKSWKENYTIKEE